MKSIRRSTLALSLTAGVIVAVSSVWAGPPEGETANVAVGFTNTTQIYYVTDIALPTDGSVVGYYERVMTDGSGKIDGVTSLAISLRDQGTEVGTASIVADVNGSIVNQGSSIKVTMTFKGNGYSTDGTTDGKSTLNLKFVGMANGNEIVGTFNGKIVTGVKSINNGKPIVVKDEPGTIDYSYTYPFNLFGQVVNVGNKLYSAGQMCDGQYPFNSSGTLNTKQGTFKATMTGVAWGRGAKVNLSGTTQVVTNGTTVTIPDEVTATGKVAGQKIDASGGNSVIQN